MDKLRILLLVTDAFGGQGGIAKFNRDLANALAAQNTVAAVVVVPRKIDAEVPQILGKVAFVSEAAGSKMRFARTLLSVLRRESFDLVICGHINLLPLAYLAKAASSSKLLLIIHGIDAWHPTRRRLVNFLARKVDMFVSVSELTKQRFLSWTGLSDRQGCVLPNCFARELFGPGPKNPSLLDRYRLTGRAVLMTCGRLAANERYKGVDEMLEILPELSVAVPNVAYLIVGDGDDRLRLEQKAAALNLDGRVVFAGFIPEAEKADHYRLADAYVMPGRGEGFGIVYLEALACGIPTVGSKLDGSAEALRGGLLGILVDPNDRCEIKRGVMEALSRPKHVPEGLDFFSYENYRQRVGDLLHRLEDMQQSV